MSCCSSASPSRRLRPAPGEGRRMLSAELKARPSPHSLMAMVNRWPMRASSRRTVLPARGLGLPSRARSSPANRLSRYSATSSGVMPASEYLPKNAVKGTARRFSQTCVNGRLVGVTSIEYRLIAFSNVMRSDGPRCRYLPRTISSSVRRDQSSASRFKRNVFTVVGKPVLRMTAFQVPEGVLTMVGKVALTPCKLSTVPKLYGKPSFGTSAIGLIARKPA